jgi:hypothetical protein
MTADQAGAAPLPPSPFPRRSGTDSHDSHRVDRDYPDFRIESDAYFNLTIIKRRLAQADLL